jgi:acyl dehydratase
MMVPVKHGDTLHAEMTVIDRKEASKPDRGTVNFERRFVRHDRVVVQEMEVMLLYRRRPATRARGPDAVGPRPMC